MSISGLANMGYYEKWSKKWENGPFRYAGVENGDACYCGNADDKFIPTDSGQCNIPCTGNPGQFCGGSWRLQVYDTGDDDHLEYTQAPTQGKTTGAWPETTMSPTDIDRIFNDEFSYWLIC